MISTGVDCEQIERFQKVLDDHKLINRMFTSAEIEYCMSKADPKKHLAARFCGKEAIIKALSHHGINAVMGDIEILNDDNGVPLAKVNLEAASDLVVQVSLSHCDTIAIAQALVHDDPD